MGKPGQLTFKQRKFVKSLVKGNDIHNALVDAKLTTTGYDSYGYQLLKKPQVIEALKKAGIDDLSISKSLKTVLENGTANSEKTASAGDVIRIAELYYRINGLLNNTNNSDSNNTYNLYIKELKTLTDKQLDNKLHSLEADIV